MSIQQGTEPLARKHARGYEHSWRVAVVSLFSFESIGVRAVYSFLKACGYDVDLVFFKEHALNRFDMPSEHERRFFIDLLKERDIKAVAISVRSPYLSFAADITKQIHDELDVPVIWGGTAATVTPDLCILGGADYAICGEAEEAMADLVTALATGADTRNIANVWYKDADGPVGNPLRPLIEDLDSIPIPDLAEENKFYVEFGRLQEGDPWRNFVRYELMASRGCPYSCTFCSNSVFHGLYKGLGRFVRVRSVEHVMRELENAKEMFPNTNFVAFQDEVFGITLEWLREFRDAYPRRIGLAFDSLTDLRSITDEKVGLLKEAGLVELTVGIQAGSEKVRRELFNRHVSDQQILDTVALAQKHGVFARYDIIADNPFESREDKRATLDLLMKLPRPFILSVYSMNYFPRTRLTELALEKGFIGEHDVAGNSQKCLAQWSVSFDFPRSSEDQCWNALFSLTSKQFIPKSLLRFIVNTEWFMRHPLPVVLLARSSTVLRLLVHGTRMLLRRQIDLNMVRRFARSVGGIQR